jgi:hypothetical protein
MRMYTMKTLQIAFFMAVTGVMVFSLGGCQQNAAASTAETKADKPAAPAETAPPAQAVVPPAKPAEQPVKEEDKEPPSIKIENSVHDFGSMAPNSVNKCQYKFSNVGKGILKISQVQSTCGCTVPELSKKEYASGESGVIDVSFHAPAYPGHVSKNLYIVSNDPVIPRAELSVKGTVVVKVIADPNKIELATNKENGGMPPLKLKSIDNIPFSITSFSCTGQIATLQFDPKEKKTEYVINPIVDTKKIQEINSGVIQIGIDHPETKEVTVIFNSLPMFELRPPRIILQNTEPGIVTKREVWVVTNYGQAFEIESMVSKNGYMKVVSQKKDGLNIGLDIEIVPPAQQGSKRRYITDELNIKIKNGPTLTVRCSGWFKI